MASTSFTPSRTTSGSRLGFNPFSSREMFFGGVTQLIGTWSAAAGSTQQGVMAGLHHTF
ncbi:hypothetical protein [Paraburkholderia sp.]|uniref:hypothetical protein n=1 Tax=Paraburkholderia sp. TaxID=1926495 RepID=UPI002D7F880A|nr:hypothetical protein [Paraburkholderia sp.]